jgi:hypothetical protein
MQLAGSLESYKMEPQVQQTASASSEVLTPLSHMLFLLMLLLLLAGPPDASGWQPAELQDGAAHCFQLQQARV